MKNIAPFFLLFMILSCGSDDNDLVETYEERAITVLNKSPGTNPLEDSSLFFSNLSYGSTERNTYDVFLPKHSAPIGVVLFFHGGSFLFNDKSDTYEAPFDDIIKSLLSQKVAIVNANYSYLTSPNSEGVITSLSDGTLLLNHIRSIASSIDIDVNKMILGGASSGAGIALWNGLQAEHNAGVIGVVAIETQSTYNLYDWEPLFMDLSIDTITQSSTEFQMLFSLFYGGVVPTQEQ
jgi:acetyl esterase/lipase